MILEANVLTYWLLVATGNVRDFEKVDGLLVVLV